MSEASERFQQARAAIEADRPVDIAETYRIIEAAAREGDPEALLFEAYALGVGYGCDVDLTLAFENIYIADEAGAPDATPQADMMNLGGDLADMDCAARGRVRARNTAHRHVARVHRS